MECPAVDPPSLDSATLQELIVAREAVWRAYFEGDSARLVELLPDYAVEGLPLHLIWLTGRELSPKVAALLCLLSEELSVA